VKLHDDEEHDEWEEGRKDGDEEPEWKGGRVEESEELNLVNWEDEEVKRMGEEWGEE